MSEPAATPRKIAQHDARTLAIEWEDGHTSLLDVRRLRLACQCAHCVDEWTGEAMLDPASVPAEVHPLRLERVGNYAIQFAWSDGHGSGIYPFRRLRALDADAPAGPVAPPAKPDEPERS